MARPQDDHDDGSTATKEAEKTRSSSSSSPLSRYSPKGSRGGAGGRSGSSSSSAWAVYCDGPLLKAVQSARLFPDSKTFVDMPMKQARKFGNWTGVHTYSGPLSAFQCSSDYGIDMRY